MEAVALRRELKIQEEETCQIAPRTRPLPNEKGGEKREKWLGLAEGEGGGSGGWGSFSSIQRDPSPPKRGANLRRKGPLDQGGAGSSEGKGIWNSSAILPVAGKGMKAG